MRSKLGIGLAFLGAFFIGVGLLAQFWAPDKLEVTPLNVDNTTHLDGTAVLSGESQPIKATSTTHTNSEASTSDIAVWDNSTCVVIDLPDTPDCVSTDDPKGRLLSASVSTFATDRVTGLAVNDPDLLPPDATPREGLVNKWPFNAEKKTYPYWDDTTASAVDAVYDRTEDLAGVECYVYKVTITDAPKEIAAGVDGTVDLTTEIYVEPLTGAIQNQVTHQEQKLEDGTPAVTIDLAFTDEQIQTSADDITKQIDQLNLVTKTVPLVSYIVGIPVMIIGIVLIVLGRRPEDEAPVATTDSDVGESSGVGA